MEISPITLQLSELTLSNKTSWNSNSPSLQRRPVCQSTTKGVAIPPIGATVCRCCCDGQQWQQAAGSMRARRSHWLLNYQTMYISTDPPNPTHYIILMISCDVFLRLNILSHDHLPDYWEVVLFLSHKSIECGQLHFSLFPAIRISELWGSSTQCFNCYAGLMVLVIITTILSSYSVEMY